MDFLKEDKQKAENERNCFFYCIEKAVQSFINNDYGTADLYMENALRSVRELQRFVTKKQQQEELEKLVEGLTFRDINIIFKMK